MASACIACGSKLSANHSSISVEGQQISWCCIGGRLFLLWILLCGFDQHDLAATTYENSKSKSSKEVKDQVKGRISEKSSRWGKKMKTQSRDNGVGFGGGFGDGGSAELPDMDLIDDYYEGFGSYPPEYLQMVYGAKRPGVCPKFHRPPTKFERGTPKTSKISSMRVP
jgi:hypothetical protein